MSDKNTFAIYVELDAILDTRLGTLARMNQEVAKKVLENNYHNRESDIFKDVNNEEYKDLYAKRDVVTLAHSTVTDALLLLRHLLQVYLTDAITQPLYGDIVIVVNTHPYVLSEEERNAIGASINEWIRDIAHLELVDIPIKELTPIHCKKSYSMMIMYDCHEWMNLFFGPEASKAVLLPEVTLFAPAIYFKPPPTKEEVMKQVKEFMHPMEAFEKLASPIIDLKLIDIKYFSIISRKPT